MAYSIIDNTIKTQSKCQSTAFLQWMRHKMHMFHLSPVACNIELLYAIKAWKRLSEVQRWRIFGQYVLQSYWTSTWISPHNNSRLYRKHRDTNSLSDRKYPWRPTVKSQRKDIAQIRPVRLHPLTTSSHLKKWLLSRPFFHQDFKKPPKRSRTCHVFFWQTVIRDYVCNV